MPTGNTSGGTGTPNAAYVPPKPWDEITADEKIERMREIIKSLSMSVGRLQSDNHVLRQNFKKHSHTDKEIVIPYDEYVSNNALNGIASQTLSGQNFF